MANQEVNTYPFKLAPFGNGLKYAILENDYLLYYGKKQKDDGSFERHASIVKRYYPHTPISNGVKHDVKVYKVGEQPSAEWNLANPNKKIYLYLSNTTSYVHDAATLPPDAQAGFDSTDITVDVGSIVNYNNIFDVVSECGAYFDSDFSYRKHAFVKSQIDGKLYVKKTEGTSTPADVQQDPSIDKTNWELLINKSSSGDVPGLPGSNNVDITSDQHIQGTKTFDSIKKSLNNPNPNALDLITFREAQNHFLEISGTAADSILLDGLRSSSIGGVSGTQVIVKTENDGKISDSFLRAPIHGSPKTIYVDAGKADGITTFSSIQEAVDYVKTLILVAPITIQVNDGQYNNPSSSATSVVNFDGIYDCSKVQLLGNITNPENCVISVTSSQEGIFFSGRGLYINGFKIKQVGPDKGTSAGIVLKYGSTMLTGSSVVVENCKYGFHVSGSSYLRAPSVQANDCDYGFYADCGTMFVENSRTQGCINSYTAINNSVIYAKSTMCDKASVQTSNTIGYEAHFGSVIHAENTSATSASLDTQYKPDVSGIAADDNGLIIHS